MEIRKGLSYRDNKNRIWVVSEMFYKTLTDTHPLEVSLYEVGTDSNYILLKYNDFVNFLTNGQMVIYLKK